MPRLLLLRSDAVRSAVARELGCDIEYHDSIDSTQTRARALVAEGVERGIVVADEQRAGQGTRERVWHAAPGTSLLASWILRPAPAAPSLFTALAGVAVARALDAVGCEGARRNWPTDVELDGRKVAGVLAHGSSDGRGGSLVLGIGINVYQSEADLPVELRATATSLALSRRAVDRLGLLARVSAELDRLGDPAAIVSTREEWRERSSLVGADVTVTVPGRPAFQGAATAIDDDGALLVRTASGVERVVAGDVRRTRAREEKR